MLSDDRRNPQADLFLPPRGKTSSWAWSSLEILDLQVPGFLRKGSLARYIPEFVKNGVFSDPKCGPQGQNRVWISRQ